MIPLRTKPPSKDEGKDGESMFVAYRGAVYLYYKYANQWYRTQMEKV